MHKKSPGILFRIPGRIIWWSAVPPALNPLGFLSYIRNVHEPYYPTKAPVLSIQIICSRVFPSPHSSNSALSRWRRIPVKFQKQESLSSLCFTKLFLDTSTRSLLFQVFSSIFYFFLVNCQLFCFKIINSLCFFLFFDYFVCLSTYLFSVLE